MQKSNKQKIKELEAKNHQLEIALSSALQEIEDLKNEVDRLNELGKELEANWLWDSQQLEHRDQILATMDDSFVD